MHTTQEWAQSAHYNMYQAQATHRKAVDQQDRSSRAHEEVISDNLGMQPGWKEGAVVLRFLKGPFEAMKACHVSIYHKSMVIYMVGGCVCVI